MKASPAPLRLHALDTDYHLFLDVPASAGPHPLLLVTDADNLLAPMVEAEHALVAAKEIPPLVIAGVGYGAGFRARNNRRGRDYTPTRMRDEPMESGGAAAYLDFLRTQVIPLLADEYRADASDVGIAGHSLGSLFGLYALFQPQPPFQRYLLSSPSIWWDDRSVLRQAAALHAQQDRLPARAFLSVGADDTPSMTGDLALLETQLAAAPWRDLTSTVQRFPDRDHYNVVTDAYRAGLRWLYGAAR